MKNKECLLYCLNDIIKKKKRTIINIILMTLIFISIWLTFIFYKGFNNFIDANINSNIEYRTMYIKYNHMEKSISKVKKEVLTINHITRFLEQKEYQTYVKFPDYKNSKINTEVRLLAADELTSPNIIYGRKINYNDRNTIICPSKFIPDSDASIRTDLNKKDYVDIKKMLNKNIKINYDSYDYSKSKPIINNSYEEEFELVGIYDNEDNITSINQCYVSYYDVTNINNIIDGNSSLINKDVYFNPLIIIDNYTNKEEVVKELAKSNYTSIDLLSIDSKVINVINILTTLIIIISFILFITIIFIHIYKSIKEQTKDFGILKSIGYKNKDLIKIIIFNQILILIISFIISIIIFSLIFIIGKIIISNITFMSMFKINFPIIIIITNLIIFLGISYLIEILRKN